MTLDRFKVFAAAARYRSVTRASEELYITQPAVTKQLAELIAATLPGADISRPLRIE